jgi:hypothetical protein
MKAEDAKRSTKLEPENSQSKKFVAKQGLDLDMPKEA